VEKGWNPRERTVAARLAILMGNELGMGPDAADLGVACLREFLADSDPFVRAGAAYGLADAGPRAAAEIVRLRALTTDPDEVTVHRPFRPVNGVDISGWEEARVMECGCGELQPHGT
jgi:hypothetical protein